MKLSYPLKDTRLKRFLNAAEHYHINEIPSPELNELQKGGWFLIGMNDFWHAGVHFDGDRPVHAVADGEIVAYRITNTYIQSSDLAQTFEGAKKKNRKFIDFPISNNFVLTRHLFKPPEGAPFSFYLLYMHLLPHQEVSDDQQKSLSIFHQFPVSVKRFDKPDGAGLQLVDGHHLKEIIVMPKGSVVEKLDNRRLPDEIFKRGYSRVRAHAYNTTFRGYADLNNDRHLKQYGDRYLVDTTIHPNPEKTGLNVRIYPIPVSAVVDVVPFGAIVYFDESAGEITDEHGILKSFPEPERYKKIKGYRHNGRDYKIDGYIYTHRTYLETKRRYEPEIDGVTCPNDLRIEKGDVLGWSGRDGTSDKKKTVHVELFMKTKKDLDALRRYTDAQLKKQTDLNRESLLNLDEAGILSEKEITQAYIRVDFMCDVSGLLKKSSNGENEIIEMGVEEAVADDEVAPELRKMVAKHHPEWLPNDKGEKIRERLMDPPYMWPQEKYDAYKELYFDKLGFWDQLNGFPEECYYFHPIKFIEHLKLISEFTNVNFMLDKESRNLNCQLSIGRNEKCQIVQGEVVQQQIPSLRKKNQSLTIMLNGEEIPLIKDLSQFPLDENDNLNVYINTTVDSLEGYYDFSQMHETVDANSDVLRSREVEVEEEEILLIPLKKTYVIDGKTYRVSPKLEKALKSDQAFFFSDANLETLSEADTNWLKVALVGTFTKDTISAVKDLVFGSAPHVADKIMKDFVFNTHFIGEKNGRMVLVAKGMRGIKNGRLTHPASQLIKWIQKLRLKPYTVSVYKAGTSNLVTFVLFCGLDVLQWIFNKEKRTKGVPYLASMWAMNIPTLIVGVIAARIAVTAIPMKGGKVFLKITGRVGVILMIGAGWTLLESELELTDKYAYPFVSNVSNFFKRYADSWLHLLYLKSDPGFITYDEMNRSPINSIFKMNVSQPK